MKLHRAIVLAIIIVLLAACNFTLAEDVTPPPGYVPPTPVPTLGPLYPASAPDIANGAIIYAEKCAACHGVAGLGDGEQGKQLPVTAAPLGLAEYGQTAQPSKWYAQVTQGNLDRFMPPFSSLSDQERWDVVAYALTLYVAEKDLKRGRELFETVCADCPTEIFRNQEWMASISNMELAKILRDGTPEFPGLDSRMTEGGFTELAAYVRTLSFAAPTTASATLTPVSAGGGTPSAQQTPVDGTQAAVTPEAIAGFGNVSGSIDNKTGAALPPGLKVILRAYEHGADPSAGPQEAASYESTINADGTFVFENIEIPEGLIYIAETTVEGLDYRSDLVIVEAGASEVILQPITVYAVTGDFSPLKIDSLQLFFDFAGENSAQIFAVYTISNEGDKTIVIDMSDNQTVPFIAPPDGAEGLGYEATQDSAVFVPTEKGFAMPPDEVPYGLIAFASIPKEKEVEISQSALLPVGLVNLYLPEGMEAEGAGLVDEGIQAIQTTNFHVYSISGINKGESLEFTITGKPQNTTDNPDITQNQTLLIGVGAFGIVLILAGVWLYMRDRKSLEDDFDDDDEAGTGDSESTLDAIIALDDLHRAGKISDAAYKQRREELKGSLKRKA
ncbi:MAG: cytochrome c [Chloroflexi bacterium]|nr:cytochrome c [Chloroflexota bacterium]